jgi:hypothetical protein
VGKNAISAMVRSPGSSGPGTPQQQAQKQRPYSSPNGHSQYSTPAKPGSASDSAGTSPAPTPSSTGGKILARYIYSDEEGTAGGASGAGSVVGGGAPLEAAAASTGAAAAAAPASTTAAPAAAAIVASPLPTPEQEQAPTVVHESPRQERPSTASPSQAASAKRGSWSQKQSPQSQPPSQSKYSRVLDIYGADEAEDQPAPEEKAQVPEVKADPVPQPAEEPSTPLSQDSDLDPFSFAATSQEEAAPEPGPVPVQAEESAAAAVASSAEEETEPLLEASEEDSAIQPKADEVTPLAEEVPAPLLEQHDTDPQPEPAPEPLLEPLLASETIPLLPPAEDGQLSPGGGRGPKHVHWPQDSPVSAAPEVIDPAESHGGADSPVVPLEPLPLQPAEAFVDEPLPDREEVHDEANAFAAPVDVRDEVGAPAGPVEVDGRAHAVPEVPAMESAPSSDAQPVEEANGPVPAVEQQAPTALSAFHIVRPEDAPAGPPTVTPAADPAPEHQPEPEPEASPAVSGKSPKTGGKGGSKKRKGKGKGKKSPVPAAETAEAPAEEDEGEEEADAPAALEVFSEPTSPLPPTSPAPMSPEEEAARMAMLSEELMLDPMPVPEPRLTAADSADNSSRLIGASDEAADGGSALDDTLNTSADFQDALDDAHPAPAATAPLAKQVWSAHPDAADQAPVPMMWNLPAAASKSPQEAQMPTGSKEGSPAGRSGKEAASPESAFTPTEAAVHSDEKGSRKNSSAEPVMDFMPSPFGGAGGSPSPSPGLYLSPMKQAGAIAGYGVSGYSMSSPMVPHHQAEKPTTATQQLQQQQTPQQAPEQTHAPVPQRPLPAEPQPQPQPQPQQESQPTQQQPALSQQQAPARAVPVVRPASVSSAGSTESGSGSLGLAPAGRRYSTGAVRANKKYLEMQDPFAGL